MHHDTVEDISAPKSISIYKTMDLNVDFDEIDKLKPHKKVTCTLSNLPDGHRFKLNGDSRNAVRFKSVKFLVIHVRSNQRGTEHTYLSCISLNTSKEALPKEVLVVRTYSPKYRAEFDDQEMTIKSNAYFATLNADVVNAQTDFSRALLQSLRPRRAIGQQGPCILRECRCFRRILFVLHKYQLFISDAVSNEANADGATDLDDVYPDQYSNIDLVNDFVHVLYFHQGQLELMHAVLLKLNRNSACNVMTCYVMKRNHRDRAKHKAAAQMQRIYFIKETQDVVKQQLIDKIHCFFHHTFDIGFVPTQDELSRIFEGADVSADNDGDAVLTKLRALLLVKWKLHSSMVTAPKNKFITSAGFDKYFSFGYRFYYWPHFRGNRNQHDMSLGMMSEYQDANEGHTLHDLYVVARHSTIKQELLFNNTRPLSVAEWRHLISKAQAHLTADIAKTLQTHWQYTEHIHSKFYGIKNGAVVQLGHLTAMMAYCNYDVCKRFCVTIDTQNVCLHFKVAAVSLFENLPVQRLPRNTG